MIDRANHPDCLKDLAAEQQAVLLGWISDVLIPAKRVFHRTSYGMKHDFEREPDGFYVTNGMFKGAMHAAGHEPVDPRELNCRFRVRPTYQLNEEEEDSLGFVGRGWLARSWQFTRQYLVFRRTQAQTIELFIRKCAKEKRPVVRVEVRCQRARVMMDMITADWKLSQGA